MATSFPFKSSSIWRADWFAGVAIVCGVVILHLNTDVIDALERRFFDFASTTTARQPTDQIAIIAIDDKSLASLGPWPWSRDLDASLIDRLAAAKAKVIVHTAFFFAPQGARGLGFIHRIKDVLASAGDPVSGPSSNLHQQLEGLVTQAEREFDTDARLASSFKNAGNVVIASLAAPGQRPIESLARAASGVGHLKQQPDGDGIVRHETLLLADDDGQAVPSVALLAAAMSLNLTALDIQAKACQSVRIGTLRIPTDKSGRILPQFYQAHGGHAPFAVDSFADVLAGTIPASKYGNKIVIIGVTAAGLAPALAAPGHQALSSAQAVAHVTSSILNQHGLVQPRWQAWITWGMLLLVSAYLLAVLPRLPTAMAILLTGALSVLLLGTEFALLAVMGLWLQLVFPAALLVIGHLAMTIKRRATPVAVPPKADAKSSETDRMMGLALQGQGQLDLAFERFRQVPAGAAILGNLRSLALDFERKQQFNRAQAVHTHIAALLGDGPDLAALTPKVPSQRALEPAVRGAAASLGRYQIERELGRGAMGVVYLGKDPTIGRVVAIKTLALGDDYEGAALVEARRSFFREAEAAGRLHHPNIVTIFDAGEERDLAYIAMEFLRGKDLIDCCHPGHLLPVPTVLSIVARVAEALAYAHRQQVVHRDIKPANVMFDIASDTVKVTDFGIARVTDANKTKTGLVLGTPSFMSPEQLAGKRVDGRSDLFSLGVMLFQMLTGVLPFRGGSMADLMHRITSQDAPGIRSVRADLPQALALLVALALEKNPQNRYQDGDQLARDLRAVLSGGNVIDLEI